MFRQEHPPPKSRDVIESREPDSQVPNYFKNRYRLFEKQVPIGLPNRRVTHNHVDYALESSVECRDQANDVSRSHKPYLLEHQKADNLEI